jgi:hypothetical protein
MKKISTLFKKNPNDLSRVINEVNPENQWVFDGEGIATRKYDGTACAIIDGKLYKRYDVKKGRNVPPNAIPCQDADVITGHFPHWVLCSYDDPGDKYHFEAFNNAFNNSPLSDGTYELCGPKINGNREAFKFHELVKHGIHHLSGLSNNLTFEVLKDYLEKADIEGIVFHHKSDDRMCKIRKSDFGFKRSSS